MDIFTCESCNYSTKDKSNYTKHLKSIKHGKLGKKDNRELKNEFICEVCGKQFSHNSSLSRHRVHMCTGINKKSELEELKEELREIKQMIGEQFNKQQIVQKPTNVYISVKQYIQDNYASAPSLTQLEDYTIIEDEYDDFADKLISLYNDNLLTKYFGDFIIKYYKKDDPQKQSIWNSDVSRLSYFIKSLINKNKPLWYKDQKGIMTKEQIIKPLLKYIRDFCERYKDDIALTRENLDNYTENDFERIQRHQLIMIGIMREIDSGNLANDIIRYIAPYFVIKDIKLLKQ